MWTTLLSVAGDLFYVERAMLGGSNVAREDSSSPRGNLALLLLRLLVKEEPGPVRAWGQSCPLHNLKGCAEGPGAHLALFHESQSSWHGKLPRTALEMPPPYGPGQGRSWSWGVSQGPGARSEQNGRVWMDVQGLWVSPTLLLHSAHSPLFSSCLLTVI